MNKNSLNLSLQQLKDLSEMVERAIDEIEILCTPGEALNKTLSEKREILKAINQAIENEGDK